MSEDPSQSPQPEPQSRAKPGAIPAEPIPLDLADDDCPRCHKPLAHDAVMCVNCGYDLKANVVRQPEHGEVIVPVAKAGGPKEFVTPGRGSAQVLAACGVFIALSALIIAGINAREWGTWIVLGTVALTLYSIILHTCTGVVAVIIAAKLCEEKLGNLEIAAARMFVAVGLFYATSRLHLPITWAFLAGLLVWAAALGIYYLVLWFLFKKDRFGTGLIALSHFAIWMLLEAGTALASWVASGQAARAVPAP
jgi:hypothetical protein